MEKPQGPRIPLHVTHHYQRAGGASSCEVEAFKTATEKPLSSDDARPLQAPRLQSPCAGPLMP